MLPNQGLLDLLCPLGVNLLLPMRFRYVLMGFMFVRVVHSSRGIGMGHSRPQEQDDCGLQKHASGKIVASQPSPRR